MGGGVLIAVFASCSDSGNGNVASGGDGGADVAIEDVARTAARYMHTAFLIVRAMPTDLSVHLPAGGRIRPKA